MKTKEKILEGLTEKQREAVKSDAQYLRIMAPAGAGKTETITRKIVYLIAKAEPINSIVAFTFTKKAAKEMKDRLYERVGELLGVEKAEKLGEMFVGTIHSYCHEILTNNFNLENHNILDANQERAFISRHGWSLGFPRKGYNNYIEKFLRSVHVIYNELIPDSELKQYNIEFYNQYKKYEAKLAEQHYLTFGQVIKKAINKIEKNDGNIPNRAPLKHLIVDEYQDINPAQEKLIIKLTRQSNCYVVGDPRQCLYEWRGAKPKSFINFNEYFEDPDTVRIEENWRSSKIIIDLGNSVARNFEEPILRPPMKPPERIHPPEGKVAFTLHEDDEEEAGWIAQQIRDLKKNEVCNYSDIGILLRSVKTSADKILNQLDKEGIPYLVAGNTGLFRRSETEAMGRIFCWAADMHWQEDPYNPNNVTKDKELFDTAIEAWPEPIDSDIFIIFKEKLRDGVFSDLTSAYYWLLNELEVDSWRPEEDLNEAARLANLGRFNTLLTDYETPNRLGGQIVSWPGFLNGLAWFINLYARSAYEEQHLEEIKRDIEAVQVSTVHQAKGLEWPIVFIPALSASRFPSSMAGSSRDWLVNKELFDRDRYEGGLNSERKVFYVAVTRAKRGLILSSFEHLNTSAHLSPFTTEAGIDPVKSPKEPIIESFSVTSDNRDTGFKSLTASELLDYKRCPAAYRYGNIWGYQPGVAEELGFGNAVHHVLRSLYREIKNGEEPLEILPAILEEEFFLPFADSGTTKELKSQAKEAITWYINENRSILDKVEELEVKKEFMIDPRIIITSKMDKIITENGKTEIRDYKTTEANELSEKEGFEQLQLYALALEELGEEVNKVSLVFPMDNQIETFKGTDIDTADAKQWVNNSLQGLAKGEFPGMPETNKCSNCDYREICPFFKKEAEDNR